MKPSDYYLGVSEFISILLPGFLVVISTMYFIEGAGGLDNQFSTLDWLVLVAISYVSGHMLFAVGALWDEVNNLVPYHGNDHIIGKISILRGQYGDLDCKEINNYQWSKSMLSMLHSYGYMEVLRKEADSKLFRSLIIPQMIFMFYSWSELGVIYAIGMLLLTMMVFWRYREQRNKGCSIAYTHIISLNLRNKLKADSEILQ